MADQPPGEIELPRIPLRLPIYVGVLKEHSPLCSIFPGRVVPLRDLDEHEVTMANSEGATEPTSCYLLPLELLAPEHLQGIVEWIARRYGCTLEEARTRIEAAPEFPVHVSHVAAVMSYRRKGRA